MTTNRMSPGRRLAGTLAGILLLLSGAALAQAPGEPSALYPQDCNRDCLIGFARGYMDALVHKDPARAHFAKAVRFSENDVEMPIGAGVWETISSAAETGLEAADAETGNAAWFGTIEEHGEPAYYAMRLKVRHGEITEVETVVQRKGALPAPFGNPQQLVHDPAFAQALTTQERRPRQRLVAVANGYFSTVEQNDGQLLTSFDPDCQRTENGISTTRGSGGAAAIAQGCEAQFKLGIYRINKRVRERLFPIVDEERGVVVGTGFFDHANTFDRYRTTDGKELKTALKWPNSITLMEAFKIRSGLIYRVEAVFTYVPYFMHSPWASAGAAAVGGDDSTGGNKHMTRPKAGASCDRACLTRAADTYMDALVAKDPARVSWAKQVRYTENSVSMMIGDGIWGTVTARSATAVHAVDPSTGNVAWFGTVEEHGQPAYIAVRLKVDDGKTSEVEVVIQRKEVGGPFGDPAKYSHDPAFTEDLPAKERLSRSTLISLADGYFSTLQQNDGTLHTKFDVDCARNENGMVTTDGSFGAKGCETQFKLGTYRYDDRVRGRNFFVVDEERGIVVATGYIDHSARLQTYQTTDGNTQHSPFKSPNSLGFMEMFKMRGGKIYRIESVFTSLPYYMSSQWVAPEARALPKNK